MTPRNGKNPQSHRIYEETPPISVRCRGGAVVFWAESEVDMAHPSFLGKVGGCLNRLVVNREFGDGWRAISSPVTRPALQYSTNPSPA